MFLYFFYNYKKLILDLFIFNIVIMNDNEIKTKTTSLFCPHCNISFIQKGRHIIHYETQLHKNNYVKCKKPFNLNKLESLIK